MVKALRYPRKTYLAVYLGAGALFTIGLGQLLGRVDLAIARAWTALLYVDAVDIPFSFPPWSMALTAVVITLFSLGAGAAILTPAVGSLLLGIGGCWALLRATVQQ